MQSVASLNRASVSLNSPELHRHLMQFRLLEASFEFTRTRSVFSHPRILFVRFRTHILTLCLRAAPIPRQSIFIAGGFPRITTGLRRAMVHPARPLLSVTSPRVLWGDDGEVLFGSSPIFVRDGR